MSQRLLALFLVFCGFFTGANAQQSLSYEMKLTRVYSVYPIDQDRNGPDLSFQIRTLLVGLGGPPIAGGTDIYLPDNQQVGWIDIPDEVIASGTYTPNGQNPMSLCGSGVAVRFDALRAWEEDGVTPATFNSGDDDFLDLNTNAPLLITIPELSSGSGEVRTFQRLFPNFANGYYGFEFSVSYTLTNGIREVIYTGDTNDGPVADACGGGQVYIHPRTEPGFTGGLFRYEESFDGGATWSALGPRTNSEYKSVIVTGDPNQQFRVSLVGQGVPCLGGDEPKQPINTSALTIFPSIRQSDIRISTTLSCPLEDNGRVSVTEVGAIPPGTNLRIQLERLTNSGVQIVSAPTALVSELPLDFEDVAPGDYRINVTVITGNDANQTLANCTTRSIPFVVGAFNPPGLLGAEAIDPGCGETTGGVRVLSVATNQVYELLDLNGTVLQSSPQTVFPSFEFTGLAPGNYRVRARQFGNCPTESLPVTVGPVPEVGGGTIDIVQQAPPFDVGCQFSSTIVNFRPTPGTGNYDVIVYTQNLGDSGKFPIFEGEVSAGGTYSVPLFAFDYNVEFIRKDNGCIASYDFSVTEDPNQIQVPNCDFGDCPATVAPTACTPNSGQATFQITGGVLPYTISVDGQAATPVSATPIANGTEFFYSNLTSGNRFVRVTDNRGCIRDFDLNIPRAEQFQIFLGNQRLRLNCNGATDGFVNIEVSSGAAGTPPYQYKIPELNDVFTDNNFFDNIPPGNYTAVAQDANGCTAEESFTVTEPAPLVIEEAYVVSPACVGDDYQVYINATGPILCDDFSEPEGGPIIAPLLRFYYEYTTDGGTTWVQPDGNTSVALSSANCAAEQRINFPLPPGDYTLQLRRRNFESCVSNLATITTADFIPPAPLSLSLNGADNPTCAGESNGQITVDYGGGTGGYELELVRFSSVNPPAGANVVASVDFLSAAGQYTFADLPATGPNEGYAVRVRNKLSDGTLINVDCPAYLPGNYEAGDNFSPITLANPTPLQGGNVVTSQALSCTETGATITVSGIAGGTPPYSYSNNGSDFTTNNLLDAVADNTITVRDAAGCTLMLAHTVTERTEPPQQMAFALLQPQGCNPTIRGNLTVTAGEGPFTYSISQTADGTGEPLDPVVNNTPQATLELDDLLPGTLYVRLTTIDGCSKLFSYPIADPGYQPLTAVTTNISPETCINDGDGSITIEAQGGIPPYQIVFAGDITTDPIRTVNNLNSGNYFFSIRDAAGCTVLEEVELIPSSEGFPITIGGTPALPCAANVNGSIELTPTGGVAPFTVAWGDGAPGGTIASIGSTFTRSGMPRAEYEVTITDGNGCTVVRSPMPGGRDPLLAEIIDVVQPQCGGIQTGGFTVSITENSFPASSSFQITLNGGAPIDGLVAADVAPGTYEVDVLDDSGCGLLEPLMVTIEAQGQITANSSVVDVDCGGAATGIVTLTASGDGSPFQYALGNGAFQNDPVFSGLTAGTYDFTILGIDGCSVTLTGVVVADGPNITGQFQLSNPDCNGAATGSITAQPQGGTAPYSYRLNGGAPQNDPTFTGLSGGIDYQIEITDANGCIFRSATQMLTEPAPVSAAPIPTPVTCFGDADGGISIVASGGDGNFEYRLDGGAYAGAMEVSGLAAGDYLVQVRDGNGCESPPINVTVNGPQAISITIDNTTPENCGLGDGTATASASGGTGILTFAWPGGQSGNTATGLAAGDYQVTVTDGNNCIQTQNFTIESTGGPGLILQSNTPSRCDTNTGSIEVFATDGQPPYTYSWSHEATLNAPLATNLAAGDYTVTVTDANNCSFALSATVVPSPAPIIMPGTVTDSRCTDGNGAATVVPSGGMPPYTYAWSHAGGLDTPSLDNLFAGDYTVSLTDANGCTDEVSFTVGLVAGPTSLTAVVTSGTTCGLDNGSLSLQPEGGTPPYLYTWADFPTETGDTRTDLAAGDYAVTATDSNGCTVEATFTITGNLSPTLTITEQTEATCGEANATVTIVTENLTDPLDYDWSNDPALEQPQATGLAAGVYSVVVTDANNCQVFTEFTIVAEDGPSLITLEVLPTACNANTGVIEVSPVGGTAPFTYAWSQDANLNAPLATGLPSGEYTVTVTDANGCVFALTDTVPDSPLPSLTVEETTASTCGDNNGSATVMASGGTPPYTYLWSHLAGPNPSTLNNLASASYTITVTDANGCTAEVSLSVGSTPGPTGIFANTLVPTTCGLDNGNLSLLTEGGTAPFTYAWAGFPTETGDTRANLPSGDYTVTVTDANGCTVANTFTIPGSISPTITITEQTEATCGVANAEVTILTENLTAPLDYDWSNDPMLEQPQATGLAAGIYSVVVTDVNNCQVFTEFTIVAADGPSLTTVEVQPTACDANTGVIEVSPVGGTAPFTYSWSQEPGLDASIATGLASGDYSVTITDANGCVFTLTETVQDSPLPSLTVVENIASTCGDSNGSATVMANGGTPPFAYEWSHLGGLNTNTVNDLPSGDYTVTVTDSNGCMAEVGLNIGTIPGPTGISAASLVATTCGLDNGSLSLQPEGGTAPFTYAWSDSPTETSGIRTGLAAGNYTVTVNDANGCTAFNTFEIPDSPTPTVTIIEQTEATCGVANAVVTIATANFTPPLDYDWSNDPDLEEPQATNLAAGVYSIVVTDAIGCRAFAEFTITSAQGPTLTTIQVQPDVCDGNTGVIEVSPEGGQAPFTYSWSHDTDLNAPLATGLPGGNYTVTVTDANGCSFNVTENVPNTPLPELTVIETLTSFCGDGNGSATLAATAGTPPYSYSWSHDPAASGASQDNLSAGDYSVVVTDVNGCTAEVSFSIDLIPEVTGITLLERVNTTCGAANGLLSLAGEGGTPPYTFNWVDFSDNTTGLVENIAGGTYPVTVIDANDCTFTATFTVASSLSPEVVLVSQTDASCGLALGRIEVEARDFTGLLVYEWSHDANLNEPVAEGLLGGEYTVLVRDERDCQVTLEVTVEDSSGPGLELVATNNTLCEEGNGSIEVAYTGGGQAPLTYSWSHAPGLNNSLAANLPAGDYTVTITDANGCTASISSTLNLEAPPAINGLSLAPATCAQNSGQASFTILGGTLPLLYTWSHDPGLNAPNADNLPPGETTFTVTDANGCFASQQFTIDNQPGPTAITVLDLVATTCGENNGSISVDLVGGQEPLTYTWSHDDDLNGPLAENLPAGTYNLTVTDANDCSILESFSVPPSAPLNIALDSVSQTNCGEASGFIAVVVTGNTGQLTYQWSHDANLDAPIARDLPVATYTLTVIDEAGCFNEQTFVIENLNNPAQVSITATPSVCTDNNGTVTVTVTNGQAPVEYEWTHDPGLVGPLAEDLPAGDYTVSVTDGGGCTTVVSATVDFLAPPTATLEVAPLGCDGATLGSLTVSLSGGTAPFTYLWSTDAVADSIGGLPAGDYQVTVTDANNCIAVASATIDPINLPSLTLASTTAGDCLPAGGSASLITDLPIDEVSVNWPGPAAAVTLNSLPGGGTEIVLFPLAAGNYPVAVVGAGGCSSEVEVVIATTIDWSASVSLISPASCFNTSDGSIAVEVSGPGTFSYQWDAAAAGQVTPTATSLGAGNYGVLITDAEGCERTLNAEIVAPDTLRLTLVEQTELVCPTDSTASLTVVGSGGTGELSYQWSPAGLPETPMLSDLPAGEYRLTLTDENGCTATLATTIASPAETAFNLPADTTICQDDLYVLDLSDFVGPLVSGPAGFSSTAPVNLLETAGNYRVTAVDTLGCTLEADLQLNVTDAAFVAGMVLPSDVVIGDSVVVLETSWPAPESVEWFFDRLGGQQVRQVDNQYWFLFDEVGVYQLSLIAGFGGCEDLTTKQITVHADSTTIPNPVLGRPQIEEVTVSPNPNNGQFEVMVSLSETADVFLNLYDTNGARLERQLGSGQTEYSFVYALNNPQAGAYHLVVQTAFGRRSAVIIVE